MHGTSVDVATNEALQNGAERRSTRAGSGSKRTPTAVVDNQAALLSLSKGLDGINQGNNALLELAQQASAQIASGGGSLREVDFTNQLAVLSQRIAKNANSLVSSDEIDPEVAFLLGKDTGTFRDILNGLLKGSDALAASGAVRADDARATLTELQKRFAALRNRRQRDPAEHAAPGASPSRPRAASIRNRSRCSPIRRKLTSEFDGQTTARSFTLVGRR